MPEFKVVWEIDVTAENKREAIQKAIESFPFFLGYETTATVFGVAEHQEKNGFPFFNFEQIDIGEK